MSDYNRQNPNQQSKADNLFSQFNSKFEWMAQIPTMQLPAKYAGILIGLIIVVIAWKMIAVSKVESDMAKKLESERTIITQQAREYADQQYVKEEERFGQVLSWAVRGELIRNNIDQIDQYLSEIVRMKDTERVVLIGEDGQLLVSTDKRLEETKGTEIFPKEILNLQKISVKSDVGGKKILVVPVMGLNKKIATLVVSYKQPKF
ncbi:MAG: hypothetical protein LZF64_06220 [Nitrosomonas sp.]|uniref:hypothetical protein n=1 Tax=Nitrosomonas sp. TaxID=42353 RepID=UPI001A591FDD|nr:hypothetical protein [Nitrosomonas sp.]MBL8501156.1 hypothetical protein [Nitrosomonas sp.]MCG7755460.1 hypothetical protein [Nitrosomonas sp.]UJP01355.1 MAG: hypothetical protein LZF64_06220 [Nitrosomonas sp.]UJP03845.1 MAG: hypothetical protein LZF85_05245 [Nitrosomonas sp.]UJP07282.1 MAG: hypothetical protein LZF84_09610 [Nitrosomonas sp.]